MNDAFQALDPAIEVMFDNVQETLPPLLHVVCLDQLHGHHGDDGLSVEQWCNGADQRQPAAVDLYSTRARDEDLGRVQRHRNEGDEQPVRLEENL